MEDRVYIVILTQTGIMLIQNTCLATVMSDVINSVRSLITFLYMGSIKAPCVCVCVYAHVCLCVCVCVYVCVGVCHR